METTNPDRHADTCEISAPHPLLRQCFTSAFQTSIHVAIAATSKTKTFIAPSVNSLHVCALHQRRPFDVTGCQAATRSAVVSQRCRSPSCRTMLPTVYRCPPYSQ
ncbi:hypothetical protein Y043_6104 [Burkholderia pseudomallei MSHR2138]|nr:hypothetical protein Y043_6104 [Burkholderia pseudomallei MSHR2138]